jgi:hypothetical protein
MRVAILVQNKIDGSNMRITLTAATAAAAAATDE